MALRNILSKETNVVKELVKDEESGIPPVDNKRVTVGMDHDDYSSKLEIMREDGGYQWPKTSLLSWKAK